MSDRAAQDEIIRFLSDARAEPVATITSDELPKARRFSRFLIRRYYRDRLLRGFRYAQMLGCDVGAIADPPEFDRVLDEAVLGSLQTAERVAKLARAALEPRNTDPWWPDLLRYEAAFFLQLATSERPAAIAPPSRGASARIEHFVWRMPELLARLKRRESVDESMRGECALLFSRTSEGRIYVVEVDAETERAFANPEQCEDAELLGQLVGIGALVRV